MDSLMIFLAAVAIGGVVNLIIITVVAWRQETVAQPYADWVDDRVIMAREYRP